VSQQHCGATLRRVDCAAARQLYVAGWRHTVGALWHVAKTPWSQPVCKVDSRPADVSAHALPGAQTAQQALGCHPTVCCLLAGCSTTHDAIMA
jgi:hypothetical protein